VSVEIIIIIINCFHLTCMFRKKLIQVSKQ
jgi:hypothetical protein